jgi:2-oxoacid:acceptor oxidoreductase delta subunit (pyruvate/2-ketoisovalerate family)
VDRLDGMFVPFALPAGRVAPATARRPRTGGWRTGSRPELETERCVNCLLCWVYCPDEAIAVEYGVMRGIDYDLCKGCEICVSACPTGALAMVAERTAGRAEVGGDADA